MSKLAFVFSGQGAQYCGMGSELANISKAASRVFQMADSIRADTSKQCFTAPKEELSITRNTQPCLFCVDLAAAEALRENGIIPDFVAGFSLGEIPALAFGGYLSQEDAFRFVCKRAEYMDACAQKTEGAMAAVLKLPEEKVESIAAQIGQCYPVNYNCPGQTVVACAKEKLQELIQQVKEHGGRAIPLAVSGAFHSPFMDDASRALAEEFSALVLQEPKIPVFSNASATPYQGTEQLFRQVNSPVLWHKTIRAMADAGVTTFVEVGAGKTLCGLISKIVPEAKILNVEDEKSLTNTLEVLNDAER